MEPTIFFLFFITGIITSIFGFKERISLSMIVGGVILTALGFGLITTGLTYTVMSTKTLDTNFTYYPLYGSYSNQTINMTNSTSAYQTFTYTGITLFPSNYAALLGAAFTFLGISICYLGWLNYTPVKNQ